MSKFIDDARQYAAAHPKATACAIACVVGFIVGAVLL